MGGCCCLETGSYYVVTTGLDFIVQLRLALGSPSFCLSLLSMGLQVCVMPGPNMVSLVVKNYEKIVLFRRTQDCSYLQW